MVERFARVCVIRQHSITVHSLGTLEVQLCTCFVPSCNYLQVTYLKGRLERVCRCCAKGEHVRDTFPSLPPTSFPRGYSFAFNCERDWSQPCVSSLRGSRWFCPRWGRLETPPADSTWDCSSICLTLIRSSIIVPLSAVSLRFAKDIKRIPMKNSANTPPIARLYYF